VVLIGLQILCRNVDEEEDGVNENEEEEEDGEEDGEEEEVGDK